MCAILDNDVVSEAFGSKRSPAGVAFRSWIDSRKGQLVIGGKLRQELSRNREFKDWLMEAIRGGRARTFNDEEVEERTEALKQSGLCQSNDQHIIALAQLSNARLLYTNDGPLTQDFGSSELIKDPKGRVYSTNFGSEFDKKRRKLLYRKNLCNLR